MSRPKSLTPKTRICITIDPYILSRFTDICRDNSLYVSTSIEALMIETINAVEKDERAQGRGQDAD